MSHFSSFELVVCKSVMQCAFVKPRAKHGVNIAIFDLKLVLSK